MAGTIKNTNDIQTAIDTLRNTADMLQAVMDGKSTLSVTGQNTGLTPQEVNRNLRKQFAPYIKAKILTIENLCELLEDCQTPGDRFLLAIFGYDQFDVESKRPDTVICLPDYDEDVLWDTAHDHLTSREYALVSKLYGAATGEPIGTMAVANELCVTRERIAQLRRKALRKMRRPIVLKKIFPAMSPIAIDTLDIMMNNIKAGFKDYEAVMTQSRIANAIRAMSVEYSENHDIDPYTVKEFLRSINWKGDGEDLTVIKIQDTDMSARTYHALYRANITSLNQLAAMPIEDIKAIRNLGTRSRHELADILVKHLGITREDLLD